MRAVYCNGIKTEQAFRAAACGISAEVLEFSAIDTALDADLKRSFLAMAQRLGHRLSVAQGDVIPLYAQAGFATSFADQLFAELRPIVMMGRVFSLGNFGGLRVAPRPSSHAPEVENFCKKQLGVRPVFLTDHLDVMQARSIFTVADQPFHLNTAVPRIKSYPLEGAEVVGPLVFTNLSNARSAALIMPVIAGLGEAGPTTVFLAPATPTDRLMRMTAQYGVGSTVRFLSKSERIPAQSLFAQPDDQDVLAELLRDWIEETRVTLPSILSAALPIILAIARKRLPAIIGEIRAFDAHLRSLVEQAPSVTVSPGVTLDAMLAVRSAGTAGVPTFELQRGIVAPTTIVAKPAAKTILAIDEQSKKVFVEHLDVPAEAVEVIGSVKLDVDLNAYRRMTREQARIETPQMAHLQGRRVILLVGQPLGEEIMGSIARLVMTAAAKAAVAVVVKLHPEEGAAAKRMYEAAGVEAGLNDVLILDAEPAPLLIVACDVVTTYFSTVALEAFALGRPVAAVNPFGEAPPYDLAELGVATSFGDAATLAQFFVHGARSIEADHASSLQVLVDGRAADRSVARILSKAPPPGGGDYPILTYAALRVAARTIEVDQGPAEALHFLESQTSFAERMKSILAIYPNLGEGRLDEAFKGFCQWPLVDRSVSLPPQLEMWDGAQLPSTLVVWAPPGIGIGAEILHLGFCERLDRTSTRFIVIIDARLVSIMRNRFPGIDFRSRATFDLDDVDVTNARHTSIMALGWITRITAGRYRRARNYIGDPTRIREKRQALSVGSALVGLAWKTTNIKGGWRNLSHLDALLKALPRDGVTYVCLQHGVDDAERARLATAGVLMPADLDPVGDVASYADYVAAMDVVITTPNSLAHFAGAADRPTILVSPQPGVPEWRSVHARRLWYPDVTYVSLGAGAEAERSGIHHAVELVRYRTNWFRALRQDIVGAAGNEARARAGRLAISHLVKTLCGRVRLLGDTLSGSIASRHRAS